MIDFLIKLSPFVATFICSSIFSVHLSQEEEVKKLKEQVENIKNETSTMRETIEDLREDLFANRSEITQVRSLLHVLCNINGVATDDKLEEAEKKLLRR